VTYNLHFLGNLFKKAKKTFYTADARVSYFSQTHEIISPVMATAIASRTVPCFHWENVTRSLFFLTRTVETHTRLGTCIHSMN